MDTAACKRRFSLGCIPLTDRAVIREPTRQDDLFFFHRDAIGCGQNMAQGIEELRKCCGGAGYLIASGIAPLEADFKWRATA